MDYEKSVYDDESNQIAKIECYVLKKQANTKEVRALVALLKDNGFKKKWQSTNEDTSKYVAEIRTGYTIGKGMAHIFKLASDYGRVNNLVVELSKEGQLGMTSIALFHNEYFWEKNHLGVVYLLHHFLQVKL